MEKSTPAKTAKIGKNALKKSDEYPLAGEAKRRVDRDPIVSCVCISVGFHRTQAALPSVAFGLPGFKNGANSGP